MRRWPASRRRVFICPGKAFLRRASEGARAARQPDVLVPAWTARGPRTKVRWEAVSQPSGSLMDIPNGHIPPHLGKGILRGGGETFIGREKAYLAADAPSTSRRAGWRPIVTVETPAGGAGRSCFSALARSSGFQRAGCREKETSAARQRGPLRAQAHSATSRLLERPAPPAELGGGPRGRGLGRG